MRITDSTALRAMAHPLRLDLIELLTALGPSTAATCARHLCTSQASCSFHLRQLAKYGFVEQAPDTGDRRERPWRLTELEQSWSTVDSGPAADQLDRVFIQREADRLLGWLAASKGKGGGTGTGAAEPEEWQRAAFVGGATLPVTAEELRDIGEQLRAVLEPYVKRLTDPSTRPDGTRFVRVLLGGTPLPHLDGELT